MAKYQKKPVIQDGIEQWFPPTVWPEKYPCKDENGPYPGVILVEEGKAIVETMHNGQTVVLEPGDYIIPEPDGIHYYPCKPDVFEKSWERIE